VEKVLDARCFKVGEGRTGLGLVNRGLGLRGRCSSIPFLLRPLFTVGRAVVVRRRFGLSQLISLGISCLLLMFVVVMLGLRTRNYKAHDIYTIGKNKGQERGYTQRRTRNKPRFARSATHLTSRVGSGCAGGLSNVCWLQGDVGLRWVRAQGRRRFGSVMTGYCKGSRRQRACHVNRARLASLTTLVHHDDDRQIAHCQRCQVKPATWVGEIETVQRSLEGIRRAISNLGSSIHRIHPFITCRVACARTCVMWPPHAAAMIPASSYCIQNTKCTETAAIAVATAYFSTEGLFEFTRLYESQSKIALLRAWALGCRVPELCFPCNGGPTRVPIKGMRDIRWSLRAFTNR
jgi:hypothetical protein